MRAGLLNRTITLAGYVPGAPDDYGVSTAGWTPFATMRAQLVTMSTEEFLRTSGEGSEAALVFRIRFLPGVTTDHRVTFEGKVYDIKAVTEIGRRETLELGCQEARS